MPGRTTISVTFSEGDEVVYQSSVTDFPEGLLEQFEKKVKEQFGKQYGNDAPAALIAEFIASYCDLDNRTLVMTGIPGTAWDKITDAANQAETTFDHVLALMISAAGTGRFHLTRIMAAPGQEQEGHAFVITGIPDASWDRFIELTGRLGERPERFAGILFQSLQQQNLKLQFSLTGDPPNAQANQQAGVAGTPAAPKN